MITYQSHVVVVVPVRAEAKGVSKRAETETKSLRFITKTNATCIAWT